MLTPSSVLMLRRMRKISATIFGARPNDGSSSSSSLGAEHQRAADRQHLLLAARQRAGLLVAALAEPRKARVHLFHVGADAVLVAPHVCAQAQVFIDRQRGEGAAAVGHVGHAPGAPPLRWRVPTSCWPSNSALPPVRTIWQIARSVVVLPAPLAPRMAVMRPGSRPKLDAVQHLRWRRRQREACRPPAGLGTGTRSQVGLDHVGMVLDVLAGCPRRSCGRS